MYSSNLARFVKVPQFRETNGSNDKIMTIKLQARIKLTVRFWVFGIKKR